MVRLKAFISFARSSDRRSNHFAIASLVFLRISLRAAYFDLSISVSSLGASYQLFTCWSKRIRWSLYWSFLDPNTVWHRLDQHALLRFISILRNPGIHFVFPGVLMADHLIENLPWKASSHPRSTWKKNASLTCALTVSSSRNVAIRRSISYSSSPGFPSVWLCIRQYHLNP